MNLSQVGRKTVVAVSQNYLFRVFKEWWSVNSDNIHSTDVIEDVDEEFYIQFENIVVEKLIGRDVNQIL